MPEVVEIKVRRGRPPYERPIKQMVSLRMDIDVLEGLRATGKGWQTRINSIMREWLKEKPSEQ
ncbi:MAG: BrnA antitoxin family protein [Betaproteobacteria bacterium]|nr:BrnA antitoxin family protein [Betaproteobacteria bacterium]